MKLSTISILVLVLIEAAGVSEAGNIDFLSSRSPDLVRIMSRNAATDAADIVSYNPAGLTFLPEGFYVNFGGQTLLKDYTVEATPPGATEPVVYETETPTPFLPSFYAVYRHCDMALFGAFTVPAGGGKLDFENGLNVLPLFETGLQQAVSGSPYYFAQMNSGEAIATSMYTAATLGGACSLSDAVSAALGLRYTWASRNYDVTGDFTIIDGAAPPESMVVGTSHRELRADKSASGVCAIAGIDVALSQSLNAAVRVETRTCLEFETSTDINDWSALPSLASFNDGAKQRRDLPAVVGLGFQWHASPSLMFTTGGNYYLLDEANKDDDGLDDNYDNGFDASLGVEYDVSPALALSTGYMYSDLGGSDTTYSDLEYSLDANFVGFGGRYRASRNLSLTGAAGRLICNEGNGAGTYEGSVYNKSLWYFALGGEVALGR